MARAMKFYSTAPAPGRPLLWMIQLLVPLLIWRSVGAAGPDWPIAIIGRTAATSAKTSQLTI